MTEKKLNERSWWIPGVGGVALEAALQQFAESKDEQRLVVEKVRGHDGRFAVTVLLERIKKP